MRRTITIEGVRITLSCKDGRARLTIATPGGTGTEVVMGQGRNAAEVGKMLIDVGTSMLEANDEYQQMPVVVLARCYRTMEQHGITPRSWWDAQARRELAHMVEEGDLRGFIKSVQAATYLCVSIQRPDLMLQDLTRILADYCVARHRRGEEVLW